MIAFRRYRDIEDTPGPTFFQVCVPSLWRANKNILLVDDNQEALRLFSRMLEVSEAKYTVIRATNGQRALSLIRQRRPDVILLDLMMPGMDGFHVLEEKKKDPAIRDIPVIVISSRDPAGEPILMPTVEMSRSGGLTVIDLLNCINALSEVPTPFDPQAGQAPTEMTAAPPAFAGNL